MAEQPSDNSVNDTLPSLRSKYKYLGGIPRRKSAGPISSTDYTGISDAELVEQFSVLKTANSKKKTIKSETSASSTTTLYQEPIPLNSQQTSRVERLRNIFKNVHQGFKTMKTAVNYFTNDKANPEYEILRWELISLAFCVELCVKYEEEFLARGKKLVETSPEILTRLQKESQEPTLPHQIILLPAKQICPTTSQWIWEPSTSAPNILVFPQETIASDPNLTMLSEHGEVFAELWKAYKNPDSNAKAESIHLILESLTMPPVEHDSDDQISIQRAILNRLMALSNGSSCVGFEKRLANDLFCTDRFGEGADGWIFSFVIWRCVKEVHGERLEEEFRTSQPTKK
ncbi:hypothetical protein BDR26DRAFT_856873 [Obelidium mucronatum]|nr:hypothetical protein BDR26DRAFT_856873 [Obelidium mucronatum]